MSRKAICLLDKELEIKKLIEGIQARNDQAMSEFDFLKKKADQILEKAHEDKEVIRRQIYELCKQKGLLPEGFSFDNPAHDIDYDLEAGVLFADTNKTECDCPLHRNGGVGFQVRRMEVSELPPGLLSMLLSLSGGQPPPQNPKGN